MGVSRVAARGVIGVADAGAGEAVRCANATSTETFMVAPDADRERRGALPDVPPDAG